MLGFTIFQSHDKGVQSFGSTINRHVIAKQTRQTGLGQKERDAVEKLKEALLAKPAVRPDIPNRCFKVFAIVAREQLEACYYKKTKTQDQIS